MMPANIFAQRMGMPGQMPMQPGTVQPGMPVSQMRPAMPMPGQSMVQQMGRPVMPVMPQPGMPTGVQPGMPQPGMQPGQQQMTPQVINALRARLGY